MSKVLKQNGVEFRVVKMDVIRKIAVLKQLTELDELNDIHGEYALFHEGKLKQYMQFGDAMVHFNHHQTKKVA